VLASLFMSPGHSVPGLRAQCGPNPIVCENALIGNPESEWDVVGAGDSSIQGFATDISVAAGDTVHLKITTSAPTFAIDIYRLGYYGGFGARKIATLPTVTGRTQPPCLLTAATRLVDCGGWSESASWNVPANAVSGVYLAKLRRPDTGGASHIVFVVRDDASHSDLLFQTSDTTWQAYNQYGGFSLYQGNPERATKVSYNRPFATRGQTGGFGPSDWVFYAEYPAIRWLEANGYNVTYTTGVDTDRRGALVENHKAFLSVGHDEYWSAAQRASVEAARDAGVHLAFLSGNEIFWKTRWEASTDGAATPYRTLVSYKETNANAATDPADPATWTGTWRDPRFSPPADGGRPENALSGQLSTIDRGSAAIRVPSAYAAMRFWRNTSVATLATGQTATLTAQTIGYEWDEDLDNGSRPAGLMRLSSTPVSNVTRAVDFGSTYVPATATHALTLYRHASGALVFAAGSVQYVWGLDPNHDPGPDTGTATADATIQQATVNLFADMGIQPATLRPGLTATTASFDVAPPASTIVSPAAGATIAAESTVIISGTAIDSGGVVAAVEVSVDGGATWHPANGRESWSYAWRPGALGTAAILSRAVDDSGRIESATTPVLVTISQAACPCTIWDTTAVPWWDDVADSTPQELGIKFQSDVAGVIDGIRFYKAAANGGTHVGHLWSAGGTLLASATFTSETTSGWQRVSFATPIAIAANTTYVASYHTDAGHYAADTYYFGRSGVDQSPLHALGSTAASGNGVFAAGPTALFPTGSHFAANYWVDVVFSTNVADTTPPAIVSVSPADAGTGVATAAAVSAAFSEPIDAATMSSTTFVLRDAATNGIVPGGVAYNAATTVATLTPAQALAASTTYTATISGGPGGVKDVSGNALSGDRAWSFTTAANSACPCTIWSGAAEPGHANASDPNAQELGVKFRSDIDGAIAGIRFYKGPTNTGAHIGSLWTSSGTLLATAAFAGETASGWQQVSFATPVNITANTVYVASYHTNAGNPSYDSAFFTSAGVDRAPLHALATGAAAGNGVFVYGASAFPTQTYNGNNYWVDVVFTNGAPDTTPPSITSVTPPAGATNVVTKASVTAAFSERIDAASVTSSTFALRDQSNSVVPATVAYNTATNTAILTPLQSLAASTTYAATIAAGTTGVRDAAGNGLSADYTWSFTTGGGSSCPCSIWSPSATPANASANDPFAQEVGVKFTSDAAGAVTAIRFYKGASNTGTHVGNLWTSTGTLLATATFAGETASGWQQVTFATPVAISAGTTYLASYHTNAGNPSYNSAYFTPAGVDNAPLHALSASAGGGNGVYAYGASAFPTQTYNANNYWVDVVFTAGGPDAAPPTVTSVAPAGGAGGVVTSTLVTATFSEAISAATLTAATFVLRDAANTIVSSAVGYDPVANLATLTPASALAPATTYTATIAGGGPGVKDLAGNALTADRVWSFTTSAGTACPCTIWTPSALPANANADDPNAQELGIKFTADSDGAIAGIRFYKGPANTGTHVGHLWTSAGTLVATATFAGETASGWQQVDFAAPVTVTANTTYVASYHTNSGNPSYTAAYFGAAGVESAPLHVPSSAASGGNGLYVYGASAFPTQTFNANNYWVDVVFTAGGADTTPPLVTIVAPGPGATAVAARPAISATFSEAMSAASITTSTFVLRAPNQLAVAATVSYNASTRAATLTPSQALAPSTTYTATIGGVTDAAGNPLAADSAWSFTTGDGSVSIWSAASIPTGTASDSSAAELGLRFSSDVAGSVTGVRFYKSDGNAGTHVANLWTNTGTLLATTTFTDETASGWQQVRFATPVAIAANTTYVVSYHTSSGHFAYDRPYFAGGGVDTPPLHALADGASGGNGVFVYGAASAFPTQSYSSSNYWVDLVFVPQ
jgi:hypothetical protein